MKEHECVRMKSAPTVSELLSWTPDEAPNVCRLEVQVGVVLLLEGCLFTINSEQLAFLAFQQRLVFPPARQPSPPCKRTNAQLRNPEAWSSPQRH